MRVMVAAAILIAATPALAASPVPDPAPSEVLGKVLPAPPVDENAPPKDFLMAAKNALAANRLDEAQSALEMAETRALVRSVKPSQVGTPSNQSVVGAISAARAALAAGDRAGALEKIDAALATPDAAAD